MTHRKRYATAASALVALLGVWGLTAMHSGASTGVRAATRPNIVLILTDDQRWDTLWSMPVVRRLLVDHGVTFANAFVTNSDCCPSRSTILTGNYSHTTGIYVNRPPHGGAVDFHRYGDDRSTIATWLHDAGYHTGLVGKYLNGYHGRFIPPGWDVWNAFNWGFHYYGFQLFENGHPKACHGDDKLYWEDPNWRDLILFYEYFHGDNGAGIGANHQTGWTGCVSSLIQILGSMKAENVLGGQVTAKLYRREETRAAEAPAAGAAATSASASA